MDKSSLFSAIPESFFAPLTYGNKHIYSEVIFKIYKLVQNCLSYGIERDIIVDSIEDYLSSINEELVIEDLESETSSIRDKANGIVRKLVDYGWIYIETTKDYKQIVNLNDYSILIIQALEKIMNKEKLEYQGNIISIYHLLFSEENINSGIVVKDVFRNTKEIIGGLKTLSSNIKKYIDDLTKQKTPEDIMKSLFGDYTKDIIDKAYHRLKTSENVAKYRPRIIGRLEELSWNENFLEESGKFYMEEEELESLEYGIERVKDIIFEVTSAFNNLDDIINDIDNKNTKYQRAAVTRAKFLLNNSRDITGQIKTILTYACDRYKELELKLSTDYLDELNDIFTLYSYGYIDETSLYKANEGKKSFKPKEIVKKNISKEEREKRLQGFKERQEKKYSIKKVNEIVFELLGDKKMINVEEINVNSVEDFIKVIYIRLYASSSLARYRVVPLTCNVNKEGFNFRSFEIWRK